MSSSKEQTGLQVEATLREKRKDVRDDSLIGTHREKLFSLDCFNYFLCRLYIISLNISFLMLLLLKPVVDNIYIQHNFYKELRIQN